MNESKRNSKRNSKEVKKEFKNYLETSENMTIQSLWNVAKSCSKKERSL